MKHKNLKAQCSRLGHTRRRRRRRRRRERTDLKKEGGIRVRGDINNLDLKPNNSDCHYGCGFLIRKRGGGKHETNRKRERCVTLFVCLFAFLTGPKSIPTLR